jgi:hypothetical protein
MGRNGGVESTVGCNVRMKKVRSGRLENVKKVKLGYWEAMEEWRMEDEETGEWKK